MRRLTIFFLVIGAGACTRDPFMCDPCFSSAIAYGSVVDAAGVPIDAGTPIRLRAYADTCSGLAIGGEQGSTREGGAFRIRMSSRRNTQFARCVRFIINPDLEPGIRRDSVDFNTMVEFRAELPGVETDSVRLDVVLPPDE